MYSMKGLQTEVSALRQALWQLLLGSFALFVLSVPSSLAQQPGIGIFTEPYDTIYVPGKPGEVPSAPTVQEAIDQEKNKNEKRNKYFVFYSCCFFLVNVHSEIITVIIPPTIS